MKGTPGRTREKAYRTTTNSLWLECRLPGEMEVGSSGKKVKGWITRVLLGQAKEVTPVSK